MLHVRETLTLFFSFGRNSLRMSHHPNRSPPLLRGLLSHHALTADSLPATAFAPASSPAPALAQVPADAFDPDAIRALAPDGSFPERFLGVASKEFAHTAMVEARGIVPDYAFALAVNLTLFLITETIGGARRCLLTAAESPRALKNYITAQAAQFRKLEREKGPENLTEEDKNSSYALMASGAVRDVALEEWSAGISREYCRLRAVAMRAALIAAGFHYVGKRFEIPFPKSISIKDRTRFGQRMYRLENTDSLASKQKTWQKTHRKELSEYRRKYRTSGRTFIKEQDGRRCLKALSLAPEYRDVVEACGNFVKLTAADLVNFFVPPRLGAGGELFPALAAPRASAHLFINRNAEFVAYGCESSVTSAIVQSTARFRRDARGEYIFGAAGSVRSDFMSVVLEGFHEQVLVGGRADEAPAPAAIRNWQYCLNRPSVDDLVRYFGYDITRHPVMLIRDATRRSPWVWIVDEEDERRNPEDTIAAARRRVLGAPQTFGRVAVELFLSSDLEICDGAYIPQGETYKHCAALLLKLLRNVAANTMAVRWREVRDDRMVDSSVQISDAHVSLLRDARRGTQTVLTSFLPAAEFLARAFGSAADYPQLQEMYDPRRYTVVSSEHLTAVAYADLLFVERKCCWQNHAPILGVGIGLSPIVATNSIYIIRSPSARICYFGLTTESLETRMRRSREDMLAYTEQRAVSKFNRVFHVITHADAEINELTTDALAISDNMRKKLIEWFAENVPEGWRCANFMPEKEQEAKPTDDTVRNFTIYRLVEAEPADPAMPRCYIGMTGMKLYRRLEGHYNGKNTSTANEIVRAKHRVEVLLEGQMTRLEALRHEAAFIHMYRDTAVNKSDPRMEALSAVDEETRNMIVARREELKKLTGIRERRTRLADDPSFLETMDEAAGAGAGSAAAAGEAVGAAAGEAGGSEEEDDGYVDEDMRQDEEDEEDEVGGEDEDDEDDDEPSPAKQRRVQ